MPTAKLPAELLQPKPRNVSDLAIGEGGYASLRALIVTHELDCFLDVRVALQDPGLLQLNVRREEDGFHVILPLEPKYTAVDARPEGEHIMPIASITVAPEKWSPANRLWVYLPLMFFVQGGRLLPSSGMRVRMGSRWTV